MDKILELRFEVLVDETIDPWLLLESVIEEMNKVEGLIEVDAADFTKIGEWSPETGDVLNAEENG